MNEWSFAALDITTGDWPEIMDKMLSAPFLCLVPHEILTAKLARLTECNYAVIGHLLSSFVSQAAAAKQ